MTREDASLENAVTTEEVSQALHDANSGSAPGPDGIPPGIIKSVFGSTLLLTFLAQLFSWCLKWATVPEQWRRAENFVLYKGKGPLSSVSSFRAISLTQILAKVYEKVLFSRLWSWFTRSALFKLPQFGFRPGSATIDAIFVLLCLVKQHTVVLKKPFYVTFVDITKAFPTISREKLFKRCINLVSTIL
jgi:hypothetical protein